ncbi:glutamate racemase [Bradyrhizobium sp. LM6.10]
MINSPTILVFDSGLGGLTVLREVVAACPDAHYVYVADDAFFPYGHHSEDQIIAARGAADGGIDRHARS